ncbi:glycoside hydrolase family 25 protein [Hymenobacter edaphi]|uniref:Muramidase n=1 Tax=Hymenobacter edaphi TaxID=2211146 RepID=A0A328BJ52_9BACT|nr:glycoside hydrolase family 25 protein [Hymenobacter edaphi]RAK65944.1 muramidase [Hymenobacter edaphi]
MLNAVVDVSHWQDNINFNTVAAQGIVGMFHKATQDTQSVDARYSSRKPLAQSVGLLWGAYHFGTNADGVAQAKHFLAVTAPAATDLLVLDFEDNSSGSGGCMTVKQAEDFVQYVHQQTGRYPGLYSTDSYLTQLQADKSAILTQCWLWVARYADVPYPTHPAAWHTWTMWQYTDGVNGPAPHSVDGIGPCDRDQFNGSLDGLRRLWNCPVPV